MFRKKHSLIKGTLILTSAGLVSRVLGFFFRIFLSHTFGEEQVGLYQLIFPFYALCLSLRSEERRVGKECRSRWSPYH